MTDKIDEALKSPYKKVKDADREVEFLSTDELIRKKKLLNGRRKPLLRKTTIVRVRNL